MSTEKFTKGSLSPAMLKALKRAAGRDGGNICPIIGLHAAAEMSLLFALRRRSLIVGMDENGMGAPRISDEGRAALAKAEGR